MAPLPPIKKLFFYLTREVLLIKKAEIDTTRAVAAQQIKSSKNIQKLQKEEQMKDTFRKLFGAAGAVAMAGLLVVAAPAGAASTDERIKALEAELQQLKTDQQRVEKDQSQMQSDALAAKMKMPSIRYRNGRGLIFRAADRSWQITIRRPSFKPRWRSFLRSRDDTNSESGPRINGSGAIWRPTLISGCSTGSTSSG